MSGAPIVAATSDERAEMLAEASDTFEVMPSTAFSCWCVVFTVLVTSPISGVVSSVTVRMALRSSSNTRPSFQMGTASSRTRTANTPAAIRPAISPPDMGGLLYAGAASEGGHGNSCS